MATAMFSTLATMAQRPKHKIMPKRACIVWASVLGVYIAFIAKLVASAASQGSTSNLLSPSVYASTLAALTKSSVHQHSAVVAAAATEGAQIQGGDITREQFIQLLREWDRTGPITTITALEWTLLFAVTISILIVGLNTLKMGLRGTRGISLMDLARPYTSTRTKRGLPVGITGLSSVGSVPQLRPLCHRKVRPGPGSSEIPMRSEMAVSILRLSKVPLERS
ncbi:hypothetical protein Pelo_19480 [Pelomyxa schiedti]|nr:hypothetical protein Pelo_19480 [Pelomyxa schiedti]